MTLLLRWVINAGALVLLARLIPGIIINSWYAAFIAALILGLINASIHPIILVLTLPINIITLGLFTLVINGLMFWFAASIVDGFTVVNFPAAFWGALLLSIISFCTSFLLKK